jgi:hypothetical protein
MSGPICYLVDLPLELIDPRLQRLAKILSGFHFFPHFSLGTLIGCSDPHHRSACCAVAHPLKR